MESILSQVLVACSEQVAPGAAQALMATQQQSISKACSFIGNCSRSVFMTDGAKSAVKQKVLLAISAVVKFSMLELMSSSNSIIALLMGNQSVDIKVATELSARVQEHASSVKELLEEPPVVSFVGSETDLKGISQGHAWCVAFANMVAAVPKFLLLKKGWTLANVPESVKEVFAREITKPTGPRDSKAVNCVCSLVDSWVAYLDLENAVPSAELLAALGTHQQDVGAYRDAVLANIVEPLGKEFEEAKEGVEQSLLRNKLCFRSLVDKFQQDGQISTADTFFPDVGKKLQPNDLKNIKACAAYVRDTGLGSVALRIAAALGRRQDSKELQVAMLLSDAQVSFAGAMHAHLDADSILAAPDAAAPEQGADSAAGGEQTVEHRKIMHFIALLPDISKTFHALHLILRDFVDDADQVGKGSLQAAKAMTGKTLNSLLADLFAVMEAVVAKARGNIPPAWEGFLVQKNKDKIRSIVLQSNHSVVSAATDTLHCAVESIKSECDIWQGCSPNVINEANVQKLSNIQARQSCQAAAR